MKSLKLFTYFSASIYLQLMAYIIFLASHIILTGYRGLEQRKNMYTTRFPEPMKLFT